MSAIREDGNILLDYARYHCLTTDHTLEDISDIEFFVPPHGELQTALEGPEGCPVFPPAIYLPPEKLTLENDAISFLADILRPQQDDGDLCFDEAPIHPRRSAKMLKLELPLLHTDPTVDLISIKRRQQPISFGKVKFDLIPVDEEADEGLEWPRRCLDLPRQYDEKCRNEKLSMTQEAALWLREQLADQDYQDAFEELGNHELSRKARIQPLTPPLSPSLPWSPTLASSSPPYSDAYQLMSERTSPSVYQQRAIEDRLMAEDAPTLDLLADGNTTDDLLAIYSPLKEDQTWSTSSPARLRAKRLKLEQPLSPPSVRKMAKTVNFSSATEPPESQFTMGNELLDTSEDVNTTMEETFGPAARRAKYMVNHEKLVDADTTMRLPLPKPELHLPVAPWVAVDAPAQLLADEIELLGLIKTMKRHKLSTNFEHKLPWNPFPGQRTDVGLEESINYPEAVDAFLSCDGDGEVVNHDALSWKPEGLRYLDDHESDDEEIEPATFETPDEMQRLLLKRKSEIETLERLEHSVVSSVAAAADVDPPLNRGSRLHLASLVVPPKTKEQVRHPKPVSHAKAVAPVLSPEAVPDFFSASNEIGRFMDLLPGQPQKRRKTGPRVDTGSGGPARETPSIAVPKAPTAAPATARLELPDAEPMAEAALVNPIDLKLPMPAADFPYAVIVSCAFHTTHRTLVDTLKTLLPSVVLIERDFAGRERIGFSPTKDSDKPTSSSTANSAPDLILSPQTCIILTTLQKVKQKALPGQASQLSPLRKRAVDVSATCERLVVLVTSIGQQAEENHDMLALAKFISFCASISFSQVNGDVEVLILPASNPADEQATHRSTAQHVLALLATEASALSPSATNLDSIEVPSSDKPNEHTACHELIEEETTWEIFLRRAGLNPFAAQVVLAALKDPTPPDDDGNEHHSRDTQMQGPSALVVGGSSNAFLYTSSSSGVHTQAINSGDGVVMKKQIYGLPAFILMSAQERRQRFVKLLGGTRILDRVSRNLDAPWRP